MKKAIAFDIYGAYAHFKTWYMTTSRTTYPLPPRTAVAGIVGAIMGVEKEDLPITYIPGNGIMFGVRSLKPIKTRMLAVKGLRGPAVLSLVGKNGSKRIEIDWTGDVTQPRIPIELIEGPEYRIYVHFPIDTDLDKLAERVRERQLYYRPYLGTANMVAHLHESVLDFEVKTDGGAAGKIGGLIPKEIAILNVQELRKKRIRLTEAVAQKAVTNDFAFHHGEFLMDMGAIGIPGKLIDDTPYVVDEGLSIPLI